MTFVTDARSKAVSSVMGTGPARRRNARGRDSPAADAPYSPKSYSNSFAQPYALSSTMAPS